MQQKNYTLPVKTNRYVFHVSCSSNRESIAKKGLIGCPKKINGYTNAIFAHNSAIPDYSWYPFCFDVTWDWDYRIQFDDPTDAFAYQMEANGYDFWRIDTWQLNNKWFLDNIGMDDFYGGSQYPLFVVSFQNIPPYALQRFKFHPEPKVIQLNGVAHIQGRFRAA